MKFIKVKEVMALTSLSKTTIYRLARQDEFPHPVPLGGRAVAWLESEVHNWMEARLASR